MALLDNLVAYWKLDEASGDAVDTVGGLTLTNTNSVGYASALINNGADFGTTSGHGKLLKRTDGLGVNMGGAFSVSFWVKNNTAPVSTANRFLDWRSSTGTSRYFLFNYARVGGVNKLTVDFSGSTNSYDITLNTSLFYHFAITCSAAGSYVITMNNSVIMTGTRGNSSAGNVFVLGSATEGSPYGSASIIDEVAVWSKELTAAEVTALYNTGAGLTYPFTAADTAKFFQLF